MICKVGLHLRVAGGGCFCVLLISSAHAEDDIFVRCAQKHSGNDAARLKCYDQLATPANTTMATADRSYLTKLWNLDNQSNWDTSKLGQVQPYRQTYFLVKSTNIPNRQPSSPSLNKIVPESIDIDALESKFQFSFKADIGNRQDLNFMGVRTLRWWAAYTQQSNWQMFSIRNSAPFRETSYEPELIATLGTNNASGLKLLNIGGVHQSNGRSLPESRSWYRIYLLGGFEWSDTTSVLVRGWQRIQESSSTDDNPDLIDYLGSGDVVVRWEPLDKRQSIALLLRNNLKKSDNRGFMQIDWATPVKIGDAGRWHIQATSGYGESLIDYNHRQNTVGLGISFREW